MDVKFTKKRILLDRMLHNLEHALVLYKKKCDALDENNPETLDEVLAHRESVIQRLEYSTDAFWKIIRNYLEEVEGFDLDGSGPKSIARLAALHHVISEAESTGLIDMISARNKTSHIYKEEIADEVAKNAPKSLLLMQTILARLNKKIDGE